MPDFYTILDKQKGLITVTCRSQPVGPGALQRALDEQEVTPCMTNSTFRALCAELLNCDDGAIFGTDLVARTRAALDQPETTEASLINCWWDGAPPSPHASVSDWFEQEGSKGILHGLRISALASRGGDDESTPVGEAWAEVLSFIHRPTAQSEPQPPAPTDLDMFFACCFICLLLSQLHT